MKLAGLLAKQPAKINVIERDACAATPSCPLAVAPAAKRCLVSGQVPAKCNVASTADTPHTLSKALNVRSHDAPPCGWRPLPASSWLRASKGLPAARSDALTHMRQRHKREELRVADWLSVKCNKQPGLSALFLARLVAGQRLAARGPCLL